MRIYLFTLFVTISISTPVFSQWSQKALAFKSESAFQVSNYLNNTCNNVIDSLNLLINGADLKKLSLKAIPLQRKVFAKRRERITSRLNSKDYIHAFTHISKNKNVRDLAVIIPGIFQSFDHGLPVLLANKLISLGYHVISLPSPFSDYYLDRFSIFNTGAFKDEMKIYYDTIKSIKERYGSKFDRLHLIGASYGAFMSALLLNHDNDNIINGMTTLFSPQESIKVGIKYLDKYSSQYKQDTAQDLCSSIIGDVFTKDIQRFNLNLIKRYRFHKIRNTTRYQQYIHDGSAGQYDEALRVLGDSLFDKDLISNLSQYPQRIQNFLNSLSFWGTVEDFLPETKFYYEENIDSNSYWLQKVKDSGSHSFRMFITKDDFTSPINEWRNSIYPTNFIFNSEETIVRNNGSHIGYATEKWFDEFLDIAFELENYRRVCRDTTRGKRCTRRWTKPTQSVLNHRRNTRNRN